MIPFNKVSQTENERTYLDKVYANGKFCGDGPFGRSCEKLLMEITGSPYALVTSSCTHALDMAFELVAKMVSKEKNEVLLSSFTFSSTANSIVLAGLKPVFCDIDPNTLNISIDEIKRKISNKTAAILPMHYAGVACEMDEIAQLAKQYDCLVVEDAAHAIGSKYKEQKIGQISDITVFSFHETKNISCGEGGAFLTKHKSIFEAAQIYREKGTNRSQFLNGQVDKYTWVSAGSSPLLAEPLSAILLSQLENLNKFNLRRKNIHEKYIEGLKKINSNKIKLPVIPSDRESNYHLFYILLESNELRNSLLNFLREKNVQATFHYIPLHSSPFGKTLHSAEDQLQHTDSVSGRLLRLPLYPTLTDQEIEKVISCVQDWTNTL